MCSEQTHQLFPSMKLFMRDNVENPARSRDISVASLVTRDEITFLNVNKAY